MMGDIGGINLPRACQHLNHLHTGFRKPIISEFLRAQGADDAFHLISALIYTTGMLKSAEPEPPCRGMK